MRFMLIGLALLLTLSGSALAHLCNNIYRTPDRIIVKPERTDLLLETGDQVRIFVRNNYPTFLRNVRLVAEADDAGVTASVTPESLGELVPGEKQVFTVSITAGEGAREGRYAVRLGISADNVNLHPVQEPTEEELIRVFEEGNPYPHPLACESLARMDSERGLEHLNELIQGSAGREVQTQAMRTGGRSGNQRVAEMLAPFLSTRDGYVRGNAILGLGYLKARLEEIQPILQVQDPFVCVCAATALILADQYDPRLPEELAGFATHDDPSTRVVAAWGCAYAGNEDVLEVIAEGLRSGDATLVVLAGDALLSLADQQEKKDAETAEAGDQQANSPAKGIGANLGWTGSGGEALGRLSSGASSGSVVEVSVAACEECADVFES